MAQQNEGPQFIYRQRLMIPFLLSTLLLTAVDFFFFRIKWWRGEESHLFISRDKDFLVKVHHSIDFNYRNQTTAACPSPTLRDGPVERQSSNEVLLAISLELEIVEKFAATHRPPAERRRREICVKTPSTHTAQKFAIRNLI